MNRNENIFLAKKLFVGLVYNTAYIEGCNITFPETQTIVNGGIIKNTAIDDIQTVLNLRDAWKYMINNIDEAFSVEYVCKINEYVSRNESLAWGVLRDGMVGVEGTAWRPVVPNYDDVKKQLEKIYQIPDGVERATEYFCYAVKNQLFWDGNKRTSTIVSSKLLIEAGAGVLTISEKHAMNFNKTLQEYYNTDNKEPLKKCLRECIEENQLSREIRNEENRYSDKTKNYGLEP